MTEPVENKFEKNPEVVEKASRRRFTKEYKQRIVAEVNDWRGWKLLNLRHSILSLI